MSGPTLFDFAKANPPEVLWGGFAALCIGSFLYARAKNADAADVFQVWYWLYVSVVPLITILLWMWRSPSARIQWIGDLLLVLGAYIATWAGTVVLTALPALACYFILKRLAAKKVMKQSSDWKGKGVKKLSD